MSTTDQNDASGKVSNDAAARKRAMDQVYAKINQEVAELMGEKDKIVFGPVEDFEFKAPLEDFQKTRQGVAG